MIETRELSKRYGESLVVDGVSLNLPAQGIVAIIGPNGAGKSTLLAMISRLMPMSAGSVIIDGMDISRTPSDILARRLAILRQDNHILSRLSVRDLVSFGRYPHCQGRPTRSDQEHIDAALAVMDLNGLSERFLDELSGGQRQRAFVAMVLCQDTHYVLLDEPLNNLDMKHAASMMQRLRHFADTLGKAIILVIHDINFASCYADHIVAMRNGRLCVQGSPQEIMQPDVLRAIYDMDIAVHEIDGRRIGVYF